MATKALNYTATEINQRLNLAGTAVQPNALNDYYTKTEVNGIVVVDLSARYTTSYANLSAALTALNSDTTTDATAIKKGGVSIKFINSVSGKYETWNLISSSWSVDVTNWINVADAKFVKYGQNSSVKEQLDKLQGVKGVFIDDETGNTHFADGRGNIAFSINSDGTVNFKSFGQDLSNALAQIIPSAGIKLINCWGDSLTAGAGAQKTRNKSQVVASLVARGYEDIFTSVSRIDYPTMIQLLLGEDDYTVTNCGVGGETINTIMARMGASLAVVPEQITIPADSTPTLIAEDRLLSEFDRTSDVKPLLQGHGNSVNPCYIEGIEGTLSRTSDSDYTNIKYYFSRSSSGRAATFPQYTSITMKGSSIAPKADATILWCWQNGGYSDVTELISKLHNCIRKLNNNNFVIVGLHTGTLAQRNEQEAALEKEFGDHFFNWRRYVSTNALYDFGITPTTDADFTQEQLEGGVKSDTYQMSIGALPSSLWASVKGEGTDTYNDVIHLNSAGYMILGFKLVERLKLIGAI